MVGLPSFSVLFWAASTGVLITTYPIVARTFPFRATIGRDYKAVNVIKGSTLAVMAPAGAVLAMTSIANTEDEWLMAIWTGWLPIMAAVYAALDLSGMIYFPSCAATTLIHHTLVQVFYFYLEWVHYEYALTSRAIVLYAGISSCEYIVNIRLALRGSIQGPAAIQLNRKTLQVYMVGTYLNCVGQCYLVWTVAASQAGIQSIPLQHWVVALAMAGVFLDDLCLIQYLWKWKPRSQSRRLLVGGRKLPAPVLHESRSAKAE